MTNHDVELIARKDAALLHEDSKKFVEANQFQYYTVIGAWCLLVKPHTSIGAAMLEDVIRYHGLVPTIAAASEFSNRLIMKDYDEPSDFGSLDYALSTIISGLDISDALQILRFPKRFTITDSPVMAARTLKTFTDTNNRIAQLNRTPECCLDDPTLNILIDEFNYLIDGYEVSVAPRFSNGVSFTYSTYHKPNDWLESYKPLPSLRSLSEKISDWHNPNFYESCLYPNINCNVWDARLRESRHIAKVTTVPKSYKTYRTIAVETVNAQSEQQAIRAGLELALSKVPTAAPIYNQAINGIGAKDPNSSTIDLSAASDSVSFWLVGQLCCHPRSSRYARRFWEDMKTARSFWCLIGTKHSPLNMVATMGNGFCFALETLVFLAIARAAVKLCCRHLGIEWKDEYATAYGDDIRVPNWAYPTTIELLVWAGFVVNEDKSFSDDEPFRESCGFDWYDGEFVSTTYWPRKVVARTIDSAPYLAALQGRLFERGNGIFYRECTNFLAQQTRLLAPTVSQVPVDIYTEYNLNGKCLVGLVGDRTVINYHRDKPWSSWEGVSRPYDEKRLYANVLTPSYKISKMESHLEEYLYASFLRNGPRYDNWGVSMSYHDNLSYRIPDSVVVTRQRLI